MRVRLEGVVVILDSSAETLISAVSSFMHAVSGPKIHLNYAQRSSKSEAFVFKKYSCISEASLCLSLEAGNKSQAVIQTQPALNHRMTITRDMVPVTAWGDRAKLKVRKITASAVSFFSSSSSWPRRLLALCATAAWAGPSSAVGWPCSHWATAQALPQAVGARMGGTCGAVFVDLVKR